MKGLTQFPLQYAMDKIASGETRFLCQAVAWVRLGTDQEQKSDFVFSSLRTRMRLVVGLTERVLE